MIRDLDQINDHRDLVTALDSFRKLMSKQAPANNRNDPSFYQQNPLLPGIVPEAFQSEKMITMDQTIFALFDHKIKTAIEEQQNRNVGTSLETFVREKKIQFVELREEFERKYSQQAKFFSEGMAPELQ